MQKLSGLLLAGVLCASLTGCAAGGGGSAQPTQKLEPEVAAAEFVPGGSAQDNAAYFQKTAAEFSKSDAAVAGKPIVDAFVKAGFSKQDSAVSFDKTPTGYDADTIFYAVKIANDCLIAQFSPGDRGYVTDIMAAVGPNKSHCLVGKTRPIDW